MSSIRYRYQTIEFGDIDIHVKTLRDKNQFSDPDGTAEKLGISSAVWPLFGVIWESGRVLADLMSSIDFKNKRILEIGCGIGLSSLLLNHRHADITATDYHPDVHALLKSNTKLNKDKNIPFERTNWEKMSSKLGKFDLIIGSDLLYEQNHADLLSKFIDIHAKLDCEIIIIDPGRPYRSLFKRHMHGLGYTFSSLPLSENSRQRLGYKGEALNFRK